MRSETLAPAPIASQVPTVTGSLRGKGEAGSTYRRWSFSGRELEPGDKLGEGERDPQWEVADPEKQAAETQRDNPERGWPRPRVRGTERPRPRERKERLREAGEQRFPTYA